jgi:hypothetical protein
MANVATRNLGSARAYRAGDRALAIANFFPIVNFIHVVASELFRLNAETWKEGACAPQRNHCSR